MLPVKYPDYLLVKNHFTSLHYRKRRYNIWVKDHAMSYHVTLSSMHARPISDLTRPDVKMVMLHIIATQCLCFNLYLRPLVSRFLPAEYSLSPGIQTQCYSKAVRQLSMGGQMV